MRMRARVGKEISRLALLALLGVPATSVLAQREPAPSGVKVGLQITSGTVVAPLAFVAGGLATKWFARRAGAGEPRESSLAYVGAWTLAGLATAAMPPLLVHGGNYPAALAGTAVGGAAAGVMVVAGRAMFHNNAHCGVVCTTWGIATFALPATGAALAYNRSR